jgi:hypothetical protein
MVDSTSLLDWEPYTDSTGVKRLTRIPEGSVEWQITARNAKTYIISFEKNFSKKHLYTSTKKHDKVQAEAKKLWDAASAEDKKKWWWQGWWYSYPTELVERAQKTLDEAKFKKQLGHRSALEGDVCTTCGHPEKSHKTGTGVWCNCKFPVPANPGGLCGCAVGAAFASRNPYAEKRTAQGKPTVDPLAGARANVNTVLLLNRIPASKLREVIGDAIIAKEAALALAGRTWAQGNVGLDVDCEHVDLDFGAALKGCVLQVTANQAFDDWDERQGVTVSVKNLHSTDPKKPRYAIVHMHGTI